MLSSKQVASIEKSVAGQSSQGERVKRQIFIGENAATYKWSTQEPILYYFDASVGKDLYFLFNVPQLFN